MGKVTGSNSKIYFWLVFFTEKIRFGSERKKGADLQSLLIY